MITTSTNIFEEHLEQYIATLIIKQVIRILLRNESCNILRICLWLCTILHSHHKWWHKWWVDNRPMDHAHQLKLIPCISIIQMYCIKPITPNITRMDTVGVVQCRYTLKSLEFMLNNIQYYVFAYLLNILTLPESMCVYLW